MSKFLRETNKEHGTNIISMNAQRHRTHMAGNVTELKDEKANEANETTTPQQPFNAVVLNDIDPKYLPFLEKYKENGYRQKEKSWIDAGFGDKKEVFRILKKPEIRAAIYEMKASDFVAMRYTGNQVLAGLMETAHFPEYWDQACDENGYLKTNIKEWPEELRHAMCGYETTEDVLKTMDDGEDGGVIIRRKFKYKFSDPLKAKMELRKHGVEVEMYEKNNKQAEIYEAIIEKLLLNQINPIAAGLEMGKHNLTVPDALKIAMQKVDPKMIEPVKGIDSEDLDASQLSDEELDQIILNGAE